MDSESVFYNKDQETIETWAYVEIMGHSRVAGRVSERKIGVAVMLQVDVPKPDEGFSHTELYSPASIFSIKPTTEQWCRGFVKSRVSYDVLPYIPVSKQIASGINSSEDSFEKFLNNEDVELDEEE